jgi:hypothetical protein
MKGWETKSLGLKIWKAKHGVRVPWGERPHTAKGK